MTQFTSAALIVNAKSRRGQKLFKRACAAMKGLPFPVDAHAVEDPEDLERTVNAALANEELTEDELGEMAIFLTQYLGFPRASGLNGVVGRVAAKRKKAAASGDGEDKKANASAAVKMNTGKNLDGE